ncbi:hypothetical protein [Flavobacterium sp.]|uniref:hypothetical protein n=1 Tax=Flavobacterium sp. TaxID=239 RepID=UPI002B4B78B0|nr:hypothetical protein [Flavobacterium sp.]HLP64248.1 hypothetical protein [Flavobacterium sp.]
MKTVLLFSLSLFLNSCSCKKSTVDNQAGTMTKTTTLLSDCPTDGKCTIEIFPNKSMNIQTDGTGAMYNQLVDSKETSVIVYQYNRDVPEGLQDGNYREEIIFEIKNSDSNLVISGNDLQQSKMLFGRFCFCRGQTGYYKVTDGNLNLTQKDKSITFNLSFTVNEVPQIIKTIQASIQ